MQRRQSISIALAGLLLAACNNAPTGLSEEAVQDRLPGTWLREFEEDGIRVRRILVLETDGRFHEMTRITDASGAITEHTHAGQWLYDGTNLKRKYTSMDGKLPSRLNLPFVALELKFESKNEFIGTDRVHKNEARYRRVQPETLL